MEKYISISAIKKLIQLIKGDIRLKQDIMQYATLPKPSLYVGKVVQYIGVTQAPSYIKGLFYYSNGTKWVAISTDSPISIIDVLPDWEDGEDNTLYYVESEHKLYVRSSTEGQWMSLSDPAVQVKQYPESDHYDPDAEFPDEFTSVAVGDLSLVAITDDEISDIFSEVV